MTVVAGNLASLLCIADGTPTPTVSWLKDGATLVPDRHVVLLNSNTNLRIRRAQVGDTGRYTCVANNTAGEASRHFNLKVMGECNQTVALHYPASAADAWATKETLLVLSKILRASRALVYLQKCLWWLIMSWSSTARPRVYLRPL